ncbi:MAG: hypothetical protein JXX14_20355 [Deltaproteobacteria bacterium]|nr:hypothetical protein [Deltaproteobacteria bacterium]
MKLPSIRSLTLLLTPTDHRRLIATVATAAALLGIAVLAYVRSRAYSGMLIDDAFITFRHARNIIDGHGFTCNPGERVEGTSSPLFTFVMLLPMAAGLEPLPVARLIGTLAFMACPLICFWGVTAVLRDRLGILAGLGAALFVACSSNLAFHSQTGMETLLYTALLTLGLVLNFKTAPATGHSAGWAVVFGFAALCRPEGFAFFCVLLLLRLGVRIGASRRAFATRQPWSGSALEFAAFCAVTLPYMLFRMGYFGELLPNSVIAKSGAMDSIGTWWWRAIDVVPGLGAGKATLTYLANNPMLVILSGAFLLPRTWFAGLSCVLIFGGCAAVYIWNGGDWMPHLRLLAPSFPALALGMAVGLRGFLFHAEQKIGKWHISSSVFALGIFSLAIYDAGKPLPPHEETVVLEQMRMLMTELRQRREPGDTVASDIAGALPYYWEIPAIDACGLCDAHIARYGKRIQDGIGKTDWDYLAQKKPVFFALNYPTGAVALYMSTRFVPLRNQYYLMRLPPKYQEFEINPPVILVRKDRPNVEVLAQQIGASLVDPGEELRRTGFLRP